MSRPTAEDGLVFDDDTSDSEDDQMVAFKSEVGRLGKSEPDGEEDEGSDEEMGSEEDESESSEDEDEVAPKPLNTMSEEKKKKLSKLQEELSKIQTVTQGSESSDSESDHPVEEEEEGDESEADEEEVKEKPKSRVEEEYKTEESRDKPEVSREERARKKYRDSLSKMTIEDIQKLKERLGVKLFNQKMDGKAPERGRKVEFKRDNKNRPREMTSKKTVGRFREVVQVARVERRDPRFDPLCGEFDDKLFKESYQFVNELKSKELGLLKKQLKAEEDPQKKDTIKYLIQRMENQLRAEAQSQAKKAKEAVETVERKQQLEAGEKPFYVSRAKQREQEMVQKFEELQEKGGLDTFIRKKTKKNLQKERKQGIGVIQSKM